MQKKSSKFEIKIVNLNIIANYDHSEAEEVQLEGEE